MKTPGQIVISIFFAMILMLSSITFSAAAEVDDSSLFVEAFNAFQKKNYLLAIEKINTLNQVFPDTPLRDVTLLLLARSSMKAGDNELAAKTINQFNKEFAANPLTTTIEEELQNLGARQAKGEKLTQNKQLRAAAQKTHNEHVALERAAAQKLEQERIAKQKAEQERIAREKAEQERKQRELLAAEKAAKEAIKTAISFTESGTATTVGQNGSMQFEIANRGKATEDFILEAVAPPEYGISAENSFGERLTKFTVAPGAPFKGILSFRMPSDKIDGQKQSISLRVTSAKYSDVVQSKDTQLVTAAPLIRVVAKPVKAKLAPGEQTRYRVTVLNVGSQPAQALTVRVTLPAQYDFIDASEANFRQETTNILAFKLDTLESGKLAEFNLNVKVRDDSKLGQELRGQVEVINGKLQQKNFFTSAAAVVQGK